MSLFTRLLKKVLPRDSSNDCGYGPFKLPSNHPFTRACNLHDFEFDNAELSGKSLAQVDWELFNRWALITGAEEDPLKKCKLAMDICAYWPLARKFGGLLWDGNE